MISIFRNGIILLTALCSGLPAQTQPTSEEPLRQDRSIFFEAVPVFGDDTSKAYVHFYYRINENFFVFVKNKNTVSQEDYVARGELIIELINAQGLSVGREIRTINLSRSTMPTTNEISPDIQGAISLAVPDGTFNILFEVDDKESGRTFVDRKETVSTRRPLLKPLETSIPFIVREQPEPGHTPPRFLVANRGSEVLFGNSGGYLIQVFVPTSGQEFKIRWKLEGRSEDRAQEKREMTGHEYVMLSGLPELVADKSEIQYTVIRSKAAWKVVFIPLPLEKLESGAYKVEFEFSLGSEKHSLDRSFRIFWSNKPLSLNVFELAVDALRLIAKEEEVDEMFGFTSLRGYQKFREFWRKRDPDTTTAYNEVMAEFYRRVDEALRRFSSPKENDGYKTDRGRILVLYGSPTTTQRLLPPNGQPTEVWTYQSLKRKFIFTDPAKNGNFILSLTENL